MDKFCREDEDAGNIFIETNTTNINIQDLDEYRNYHKQSEETPKSTIQNIYDLLFACYLK